MHAGFGIEVVDHDEFLVVVDDASGREGFGVDGVSGKTIAALEDCFLRWLVGCFASWLVSHEFCDYINDQIVEGQRDEIFLQAFGLAEFGKRLVDCLPGTDVLCTCSSKSSAEARFCFDILVAFNRCPAVLVLEDTE